MTNSIGIDCSNWEPKIVGSELAGHIGWLSTKAVEVDDRFMAGNTAMNVDAFIDPTLAANVQTAYDLKIPCCVYIFDNPDIPMLWYASAFKDHVKNPNDNDLRIRAMRQALKNKTYHAICIDVERYWKFYNNVSGERIPSLWIRDSAQDLMIRLQEDMSAGYLRKVPIWFYTGKWFVDSYCPDLDTFLADKLQWLADYTTTVYTQTKGQTMTWEQLAPIVNGATYNPKWVGNKRCEVLQLTDNVTLPGIYSAAGAAHPVDLDVIIGDASKLFAPGDWGTVTPTPPPDPIPLPTDPTIYAALAQLDARTTALEAKLAAVKGVL